MRLWSLHPSLLDRAALVAGWREALLAQKVLRGQTVGYRHHPQLTRFRQADLGAAVCPAAAHNSGGSGPAADHSETLIAAYLHGLADEADRRGYHFRRELVLAQPAPDGRLTVTSGQLALELDHLRRKVSVRAPQWLTRLDRAAPHPLFVVVEGPAEPWERATR
ncbi:pyrimidine dimer DNA glycosylase/endonuclease V [Actinomyces sp. W5033]|uniref:pyrimidine dimer DNA glycosylase/endonuclease V n=1 Tax=Actinomyces sp. W5033 TaxID=3446479 RepID=UPI003EE3576B